MVSWSASWSVLMPLMPLMPVCGLRESCESPSIPYVTRQKSHPTQALHKSHIPSHIPHKPYTSHILHKPHTSPTQVTYSKLHPHKPYTSHICQVTSHTSRICQVTSHTSPCTSPQIPSYTFNFQQYTMDRDDADGDKENKDMNIDRA